MGIKNHGLHKNMNTDMVQSHNIYSDQENQLCCLLTCPRSISDAAMPINKTSQKWKFVYFCPNRFSLKMSERKEFLLLRAAKQILAIILIFLLKEQKKHLIGRYGQQELFFSRTHLYLKQKINLPLPKICQCW